MRNYPATRHLKRPAARWKVGARLAATFVGLFSLASCLGAACSDPLDVICLRASVWVSSPPAAPCEKGGGRRPQLPLPPAAGAAPEAVGKHRAPTDAFLSVPPYIKEAAPHSAVLLRQGHQGQLGQPKQRAPPQQRLAPPTATSCWWQGLLQCNARDCPNPCSGPMRM